MITGLGDERNCGLTLEPSGVGKDWRSIRVMEVFLKRGFSQSEYAVDSPKAPPPMMMTEDGISTDCEEAIVKAMPVIGNETADLGRKLRK